MKNDYKFRALSVVLGMSGVTLSAQAATFQPGDRLTINSGVVSYDSYGNQVNVSSGSWFALDYNSNNQITGPEKISISAIPGGGVPIASGPTVIQQVVPIDTWTMYGGIPGYDYLTVGVTGGTTNGLDFSGWTINFNGAPVTAVVDYGAWTPTNCATLGCSGASFIADTAAISWDGVYGSSYSLWYSWRFVESTPGNFIDNRYLLHLEGVVLSTVPVPAAAWLFGSGLLGLMAGAWRGAGHAQLADKPQYP